MRAGCHRGTWSTFISAAFAPSIAASGSPACSNSIRTPGASRVSSTTSAAGRARAARCTAFRSSSRTTSTPRDRHADDAPARSRSCGARAPQDATVGAAAARGRRRHPRQGEPERVGQLPRLRQLERLERRGRATRNPYVLDRNPCGSSSGSAAAVAADAHRGLARHRDGRLDRLPVRASRRGRHQADRRARPAAPASCRSRTRRTRSARTARTVADAAAVLGALVGIDPRDPATPASAGQLPPRLHAFVNPDGLAGRQHRRRPPVPGVQHRNRRRSFERRWKSCAAPAPTSSTSKSLRSTSQRRPGRADRPDLRVQARPERLSRDAPRRAGPHARRRHPVQLRPRRGRS